MIFQRNKIDDIPLFKKTIVFMENSLSCLNCLSEGTIFEDNISNTANFMEPTLEKYSKGTGTNLISGSTPSIQDWENFSSLMMFEDYSEQFSDVIPDLEYQ